MKHIFLVGLTNSILLSTAICQTPRPLPDTYSGTAPINYVRTWDVVKPITNPNDLTISTGLQTALITTQYLDGLGRPIQTVAKQGALVTGGTANDMMSMVEYDEFGRERFSYLPSPANNTGGNTHINDGLFKLNPFAQQQALYNTYLGGQYTEVSGGQNWAYGQTSLL